MINKNDNQQKDSFQELFGEGVAERIQNQRIRFDKQMNLPDLEQKFKTLEDLLQATKGNQILISLEKLSMEKKLRRDIQILKNYEVNFKGKTISLSLLSDTNTFNVLFNKIEDINYLQLKDNEVKVWVYMNEFTWRFYLYLK